MSAQLAQSVWRVSFSFLSLSSSPVLVHIFFKTNFYFFLKYFHVFFYLPIVFFNHSRVKIKI